jgi:hypothetical protein
MPIASSDIAIMYTVTTGAAGNSTAGTAAGSLGKYSSTTAMATGANGLFDDISGAENAASTVDYRAVTVLNNHATLTLQNAVVYISSETAGGAGITIAVDNVAVSAKGSSSAQGDTIANETTAPTAVGSYSAPTTAATGLALGNIGPGQVKMVWVKRTATNSAAIAETLVLGISGDTGP